MTKDSLEERKDLPKLGWLLGEFESFFEKTFRAVTLLANWSNFSLSKRDKPALQNLSDLICRRPKNDNHHRILFHFNQIKLSSHWKLFSKKFCGRTSRTPYRLATQFFGRPPNKVTNRLPIKIKTGHLCDLLDGLLSSSNSSLESGINFMV